jgi:hypothetical protein
MKKKLSLVYPYIPSPIRPVPHGDGLPVHEPPDCLAMCSDDEDNVFFKQRRTAAIFKKSFLNYMPFTT